MGLAKAAPGTSATSRDDRTKAAYGPEADVSDERRLTGATFTVSRYGDEQVKLHTSQPPQINACHVSASRKFASTPWPHGCDTRNSTPRAPRHSRNARNPQTMCIGPLRMLLAFDLGGHIGDIARRSDEVRLPPASGRPHNAVMLSGAPVGPDIRRSCFPTYSGFRRRPATAGLQGGAQCGWRSKVGKARKRNCGWQLNKPAGYWTKAAYVLDRPGLGPRGRSGHLWSIIDVVGRTARRCKNSAIVDGKG
jgi:hypothetical protein